MNEKLGDYIFYKEHALSPMLCETLIRTFESYPEQQTESGFGDERNQVTGNPKRSGKEINVSRYFHTKEWNNVHEQMTHSIKRAVGHYYDVLKIPFEAFPEKFGFEEIRMKKYDNNGKDQFGSHVDVGDYKSARRFLVILFYLNTVEVGGETFFPDIEKIYSPRAGSVIIFPPMWMFRHEGRMPISSPKYVIGSYLHYL